MKKSIVALTISFVVFNLLFSNAVRAETGTVSAAQNLLDRVATKVATLAEKLKKGVAGEITVIGTKTISLGNQKVLVSEATTYYRIRSGNRTTIEFKNLVKGDDVAVVGTLDSATDDITARQIVAKVQRLAIAGKVTNIDKKKNLYTLSLNNESKDVEIDLATVVKKLDAKGLLIKGKYTDIVVGDNLVVYGYYTLPAGRQASQTEPLTTLKAVVLTTTL